jgi:uncharacterized delta-60 repeat protein
MEDNGVGVFNGLVLTKYLPNGHFDPSFGKCGLVQIFDGDDTSGWQLGLEPDGKILASSFDWAERDTAIYQFDSDGSLAPLDPNGRIIVYGGDYGLPAKFWIADNGDIDIQGPIGTKFYPYNMGDMRIHANGSPVTTFGTNGIRLDLASPFGPYDPLGTMLSDGSYLYASVTSTSVTAVRHDANGQLDARFGTDGRTTIAIDDFPSLDEELLEDDGKLLLIGTSTKSQDSTQLFVVRLMPDGQIDSSFGTGSVEYFPGSGIAIERVKQAGQTLEVLLGTREYATVGPFQLIDFAL